MSKVETTSKVSLKLPSRINLDKQGAPAEFSTLDTAHKPPLPRYSPERAKDPSIQNALPNIPSPPNKAPPPKQPPSIKRAIKSDVKACHNQYSRHDPYSRKPTFIQALMIWPGKFRFLKYKELFPEIWDIS